MWRGVGWTWRGGVQAAATLYNLLDLHQQHACTAPQAVKQLASCVKVQCQRKLRTRQRQWKSFSSLPCKPPPPPSWHHFPNQQLFFSTSSWTHATWCGKHWQTFVTFDFNESRLQKKGTLLPFHLFNWIKLTPHTTSTSKRGSEWLDG